MDQLLVCPHMFDPSLRQIAARLANPVAQRVPIRVKPNYITTLGLFLGIACAAAASQGWVMTSVVLWVLNRLADGFDGALARTRRSTGKPAQTPPADAESGQKSGQSTDRGFLIEGSSAKPSGDLGGYVDLMADFISYVLIPIGIAWRIDNRVTWISLAALFGVLYVNLGSWTLLAAIQERRGFGVNQTGESTTITMPTALIEGSETIAAYGVMLLFPSTAATSFAVFAALVTVSAFQRFWWARKHL